jgi:chromate transport protein ChrA
MIDRFEDFIIIIIIIIITGLNFTKRFREQPNTVTMVNGKYLSMFSFQFLNDAYVYICLYTFVYIYMYIYINIYTHVYIYYIYTYVHIYICIFTYIYVYLCINMWIQICMYIQICINLYVHICIYRGSSVQSRHWWWWRIQALEYHHQKIWNQKIFNIMWYVYRMINFWPS